MRVVCCFANALFPLFSRHSSAVHNGSKFLKLFPPFPPKLNSTTDNRKSYTRNPLWTNKWQRENECRPSGIKNPSIRGFPKGIRFHRKFSLNGFYFQPSINLILLWFWSWFQKLILVTPDDPITWPPAATDLLTPSRGKGPDHIYPTLAPCQASF